MPISEIIRQLPEPLIHAVIPEAAFAAGAESPNDGEPSPLQKAALDFALEVLEFMSVKI